MNCHDCNEAQKIYRGCNGKPIQPYLVDGKPLDKCPAKIIPLETREYIKYYSYYKKGLLPFEGGVSMQPEKLLQIFDIIEYSEVKAQKNKLGSM